MQKYTHTFENEMNDAGILEKNDAASLAATVRNPLRTWYLNHARPLPWRESPTLYGTWLSEIMLQQTRVDTGIPKWHAFLEAFPTVHDLAEAAEDDVLKAWEGLGYYRRARLLHKAAKQVASDGHFPENHEAWLKLPGVGPYTSAAIASIGLGEPVAAVDGNVQRVISRFFGLDVPVDAQPGATQVQQLARAALHPAHPGDHNQAMMELGALVCTPSPSCEACPLAGDCRSAFDPVAWRKRPVKTPKKPPTKWPLTLHLATHGDSWVVVQRPASGVWAKLWCLPEVPPPAGALELGALMPPVRHVLSHRVIEATFLAWQVPSQADLEQWSATLGGRIVTWESAQGLAFPRLVTKHWEAIRRRVAPPENA